MNDVIHILSSPATRDPPPRVDLGVVEITDSEPEGDDLLWTELMQETAQPDASSHRCKDCVTEHSTMNFEIPVSQAGPSSRSPAPDPFPDAPVIHIQPGVGPQEVDKDPYSKHLSLVLEFLPDVPPQHVLELIEKNYLTYRDQVGEWVIRSLFDDPSRPKIEDGVAGERKGKRKASEMEDVAEPPPTIKIDYTSVDRPKPTGKNYREVSLVSCPSSRTLILPALLMGKYAVQNQLYTDFPRIPVTHVRRIFGSNNGLYTPAYMKLDIEMKTVPLPFRLKAVKTYISVRKGKQKEIRDEDFEKERVQLKNAQVTQEAPETDESPRNQAPGDVGTSGAELNTPFEDECCLECGCCFSPAPFVCFPP
jgi:hypothetical protein